ncbi:MAG: SRPBCC domain-containing protein [Balneolaceae bacterium]|nr:SRPBCC domain-containing protein [Balneolaceae bacterium]
MRKSTSTALEIGKTIQTGSEEIWKALTEKNLLERWFNPGGEGWSTEADFKPEEGNSYRITMISPEGERYLHEGEFREVIPRKKLVFTWNSDAVKDTIVTILIDEVGDETEVKLIHEFMPDAESVKRHRQGWTEIFENLNEISAEW